MASIINRNGKLYAQWHDSTRKPQTKRLSLKTASRKTGKRLLQDLDDAYRLGKWDPWLQTVDEFYERPKEFRNISDLITLFLSEKELDGLAKGTVKLYRSDLGNLAKRVGQRARLERLSASQIEAFVKDESVARSTQSKRFRVVRAFLNWCERKDHLRENPLRNVTAPKLPHQLPRAVRSEDLERICDAIHSDYERKLAVHLPNGRCREGDLIWCIPLFWFALYTGMRISEVARLRWQHIDTERKLIYILKQKNGKQQTIPLNSKAAEVLESVAWGADEAFMFKSPRAHSTQRSTSAFINRVTSLFTRYRRVAGIRDGLTFHGLRHGHCTMLAEAGKSAVIIKASARHAHIQTSMRYVDVANEHLKAELDDVFG